MEIREIVERLLGRPAGLEDGMSDDELNSGMAVCDAVLPPALLEFYRLAGNNPCS